MKSEVEEWKKADYQLQLQACFLLPCQASSFLGNQGGIKGHCMKYTFMEENISLQKKHTQLFSIEKLSHINPSDQWTFHFQAQLLGI